MGKFYSKKKKKRQRVTCALTGGYWLGEAGGRLTRNRASYVIGLEGNIGFCWLVLSLKKESEQKQLSVTLEKVLTLLGSLLQTMVWLPGLCMWSRVLLLYVVWPLFIYSAS